MEEIGYLCATRFWSVVASTLCLAAFFSRGSLKMCPSKVQCMTVLGIPTVSIHIWSCSVTLIDMAMLRWTDTATRVYGY